MKLLLLIGFCFIHQIHQACGLTCSPELSRPYLLSYLQAFGDTTNLTYQIMIERHINPYND